jgi:hypothetical protein
MSGRGPAYIQPGGRVGLFTDFKVNALQKDGGIILRSKTGSGNLPTDWYSRNKVFSTFWDNTLWYFFGDFSDSNSQINEGAAANGLGKYYGYHWSDDGLSSGPFERVYTVTEEYEPQILIPVDTIRAYTFSHITTYRLCRFMDPTKYVNTISNAGSPVSNSQSLVFATPDIPVDVKRIYERPLKYFMLFMEWNDSETLTIAVAIDVNRRSASCTYSQTRVSGLIASSDFDYRDFITIYAGEDMGQAHYFKFTTTKVIPSTGAVEVNGYKIWLQSEIIKEDFEHQDNFGQVVDLSFVVEAGTDPPVNAYG